MSLDLAKTDNRVALKMVKGKQGVNPFIPIAWCKEYGQGKVFHISLGHNESVWADPRYQQSLLGGHQMDPRPRKSRRHAESGSVYPRN